MQLSKTFSEILESGESTSARLDEPIDAIEKVAIDAFSQVYGGALIEAFDNEILRKALIATISDVSEEQTEQKEAEKESE